MKCPDGIATASHRVGSGRHIEVAAAGKSKVFAKIVHFFAFLRGSIIFRVGF
jgi:hypothetical protein